MVQADLDSGHLEHVLRHVRGPELDSRRLPWTENCQQAGAFLDFAARRLGEAMLANRRLD